MSSIIFKTATRYMFPPLLVFSIYLLLRGHHFPGGGFVGGLLAGAAFMLHSFAFGVDASRKALRRDPRDIMTVGLLLALLSGLPGVWSGETFMTGIWWEIPIRPGVAFDLGTPVIFDIGVYFTVLGVLLTLVFALGEEE